jgi:hypothetical protein
VLLGKVVEGGDLQTLISAVPAEAEVGVAATLSTESQAMNQEKTSMNTRNWRIY